MLATALVLGLAAAAAAASDPRRIVPRVSATVEVVGVTPADDLGIPERRLPANVQVVRPGQQPGSAHVAGLVAEGAAMVTLADVHGGAFQPDLLFRGFTGSPLLGSSGGVAVYQNGVRMNEPFGDTVHWDALPAMAVAAITVVPGSNPLFGSNALGGAVSIRTTDGFDAPGTRAAFTAGSFGRTGIDASAGGSRGSLAGFAAASFVHETGWRDHSPSTLRRIFGDIGWRGSRGRVHLTITGTSNDLTGNGAAPVALLAASPTAVFTHPDRTGNDLILLGARYQYATSPASMLQGLGYVRYGRIHSFNGDAREDESDDQAAGAEYDALNNIATTRSRVAGLSAQWTRAMQGGGHAHHLVAGAGVDASFTRFDFGSELARLTDTRGTVGSGIFDPGAAVNLHTRASHAYAFVTSTWSPVAGLSATAAARLNRTIVRLRDQLGTALTGDHAFARVNLAAGVTYDLDERANLFAGFSQSSRTPTPVELTCADPEDPCRLPNAFVSDPPLDEAVASTWEAGARGHSSGTRWNIAVFRTIVDEDILFVSSGTLRGEGHFENAERTRRTGVEARLEYTAERWSGFGTYALQRATFGTALRVASRFHPTADRLEIPVEPGDRLPGIPVHTAKLGVTIRAGEGWQVRALIRAQSGSYLRGDEGNLLEPLHGFTVADATLARTLGRHVTVSLRVRNLFDADYSTFGVLGEAGDVLGSAYDDEFRFVSPGGPRAIWVGLSFRR